jgi:hypothetical protein
VSEGSSDDSPGDGLAERAGNRVVVDVFLYAAARLLLVVAISGAI